jgi:hypothetical protein
MYSSALGAERPHGETGFEELSTGCDHEIAGGKLACDQRVRSGDGVERDRSLPQTLVGADN